MKKPSFFIVILLLNCSFLFSQVAINTDGSAPDNSAILDVKSGNKGVLIPRVNFEQRNTIANPAEGLLVFCIDCGIEGSLSIYSNGTWKSFSLCSSSAPVAGENTFSPGQIVWRWSAVDGAVGYKWSTTNYYSSAIDAGPGDSITETGIAGNSDYTRYVWSYNSCSNSAATTLIQTTYTSAPGAPVPGTPVPSWDQIVWNWSTVADASGYKWSSINDYASAIDKLANTTEIESGLTCGNNYTRYAWAYNSFGYSTEVSLTQSTLQCATCGNPITIYHMADTVAPVTKTVTYGTVTNIPGESNHCWITSNLGADHQATAVNDATEASAGWYWQFNLTQGYKHDGTTRTPNTTWINTISELSNWTADKDPCTLELGSGWRLPTGTEWSNVDVSGGWTNWTGPWNSALKMHAAGRLYQSTGVLEKSGIAGGYWSSTQSSGPLGQALYFYNTSCSVSLHSKTMGYSVRCLRN